MAEDILDSVFLRNTGYLLGGRINSGAFSTVYCGIEVKQADVVAIKIMDLKSVSQSFRTRFLPRELANIKRLNHPNIVKVRKITRNENKIYIVMDYARSNLRKEIDIRTSIGEKQARKWFGQLSSAIEYLQSNGVAHRDIKIDNILIDEQGILKLCDFGFSKLVTTDNDMTSHQQLDNRSSTFCGSIAYCAPEILHRTPYDPWKADVWSLGVVLYKMVIGVMPFGEGNDLASVHKITRAQSKSIEFPPFPRTSYHCQQLIRALLTFESDARISLNEVQKSPWMNPPPPSTMSSTLSCNQSSSTSFFSTRTRISPTSTLRRKPSQSSSRCSRNSASSSVSSFAAATTASLLSRLRKNFPLLNYSRSRHRKK